MKRPIETDDATWQKMLGERKKEAERRMEEHDSVTGKQAEGKNYE